MNNAPLNHLCQSDHFDYRIKRQTRKTLVLHILADATVEVRAPMWVPTTDILTFVNQRTPWVLQQRQRMLNQKISQPAYQHGHKHWYLGQAYPLHIEQAKKSIVRWENDTFFIQVRDPANASMVKKVLENGYRRWATTIFRERLAVCYQLFPRKFKATHPLPTLSIRRMRRRWGSCSHTGHITLNLWLVKRPLRCINYVIVHELCHLQVFNHSPAFYRLMATVMPDWQQQAATMKSWD